MNIDPDHWIGLGKSSVAKPATPCEICLSQFCRAYFLTETLLAKRRKIGVLFPIIKQRILWDKKGLIAKKGKAGRRVDDSAPSFRA
jgi:hypothetical protein